LKRRSLAMAIARCWKKSAFRAPIRRSCLVPAKRCKHCARPKGMSGFGCAAWYRWESRPDRRRMCAGSIGKPKAKVQNASWGSLGALPCIAMKAAVALLLALGGSFKVMEAFLDFHEDCRRFARQVFYARGSDRAAVAGRGGVARIFRAGPKFARQPLSDRVTELDSKKPGAFNRAFCSTHLFSQAAFLVSMPSTRLTAVCSSVRSTAATSRAIRASAFS
jgi:hypothetical protein